MSRPGAAGRFKAKAKAVAFSARIARKSPLFKQEWTRFSREKIVILDQLSDVNQMTLLEDLLLLIKDDFDFLNSCLAICMETNQIDDKFIPLLRWVKKWVGSCEISLDLSNLYDLCFGLAVDYENEDGMEKLLTNAEKDLKRGNKPPDNNPALIKACELNHFELVKLMVSKGYRLRSYHKERQQRLKKMPMPFFAKKIHSENDQIKTTGYHIDDEVNELNILRMMSKPAYILSCYTTLTKGYDQESGGNETCSCRTPTMRLQGIRKTVETLEMNDLDQPDGNIGFQEMMSSTLDPDFHLCPNNKNFRPVQNCRLHPECNDPIFRCFDLAKVASKLANKTPEYRSEYEAVAQQCRNLSVELLDQCQNTQEVETVLTEATGTSKYFRYAKYIKYPRLRLAIEHNHKEFVGHMYCQQMLRQQWHDGTPWLGKSLKYKLIYSLLLNLWIPFYMIHWSFTQIGIDIQWLRKKQLPDDIGLKECSRVRRLYYSYLIYCEKSHRTIDNPLNKFIIFTFYYIVYLSIILGTVVSAVLCEGFSANVNGDDKFTFLHVILLIYAVSMLWSDIKLAITLRSVNSFFKKFWRAYDLVMHLSLGVSLLLWIIIVNGFGCNKNNSCTEDEKEIYKDLNKASTLLLSVAATLSINRVIYWFLLHDVVGPVVINMARAITDILTIGITYGVVLMGFTSGMSFLVHQRENSLNGPSANCTTKIGFTKMMVTLFWGFFDPGQPSIFGDDNEDNDLYAAIGYALYAIYLMVIVIVLLNLLIAILNATVQKVYDSKQLYWKFARTSVWMEFYDEFSTPPIPFSIFQILWSITFFSIHGVVLLRRRIFHKERNKIRFSDSHKNFLSPQAKEETFKHTNLMLDLVDRYVEKKASIRKPVSSETHLIKRFSRLNSIAKPLKRF